MTITELLIATAIALGLVAALFGITDPLQRMFDGQLEVADVHQRLRVGAHMIERDLLAAGSPVMPYRAGLRRPDPALGVFYRDDTITLVSRHDDGSPLLDTYYLRRDTTTGASELMHYDGDETDAPVMEHVVRLAFEYLGADGEPLEPAILQDGPWLAGEPVAGAFDADLLRIRRVRFTLRVEAARAALRGPAGTLFARGGTASSMERFVRDRELRMDVVPRNLLAE
jgi:hypothetical protein